MNRRKSLGSHRRYWLIAGAVWYALVAVSCGGGGGSAPAYLGGTVNVSLASAPQDSSPASQAGIAASDILAQPSPADDIDHAWITIYRVALLPGSDGAGPDPSGEPSVEGEEGYPGMIAGEISPAVEVDLLDLPQGQTALFLNAIDNVPAGAYKKIRLFYTDPKVHFDGSPDNTAMLPTANYHLDIHFKGGSLVVPVSTGSEGGVVVHDVTVFFVPGKDGLKITVNPNKILMRPQVFATVVGAVKYLLSGIADNVDKSLRAFDVSTSVGRSFHVEYDAETVWSFRDDSRSVDVTASAGEAGLDNTAFVDVFGVFSTSGNFAADDIHIMFPLTITDNVISGDTGDGWNEDTFTLDRASDNVVFPMPGRFSAFYDNAVSPFNSLDDSFIVKGAKVTARGYRAMDGVKAYWISIFP